MKRLACTLVGWSSCSRTVQLYILVFPGISCSKFQSQESCRLTFFCARLCQAVREASGYPNPGTVAVGSPQEFLSCIKPWQTDTNLESLWTSLGFQVWRTKHWPSTDPNTSILPRQPEVLWKIWASRHWLTILFHRWCTVRTQALFFSGFCCFSFFPFCRIAWSTCSIRISRVASSFCLPLSERQVAESTQSGERKTLDHNQAVSSAVH